MASAMTLAPSSRMEIFERLWVEGETAMTLAHYNKHLAKLNFIIVYLIMHTIIIIID